MSTAFDAIITIYDARVQICNYKEVTKQSGTIMMETYSSREILGIFTYLNRFTISGHGK